MRYNSNLAYYLIRYNLKIIFANKFIYFLITALAYYLLILVLMIFTDAVQTEGSLYGNMIMPGLLVMFYPVVYGIQNDRDNRMLEIILSIPNFRYKVYLVRLGISLVLLVLSLWGMLSFTSFAIMHFNTYHMLYQLMFLMFFMLCLSFFLSTLVKNGNSAAVVLIIIGLIFAILSEPLEASKWNLFLNPFSMPRDLSATVWQSIINDNRIILMVGSVIFLGWSFINLQKRERYI